jgi:hypothetical protein
MLYAEKVERVVYKLLYDIARQGRISPSDVEELIQLAVDDKITTTVRNKIEENTICIKGSAFIHISQVAEDARKGLALDKNRIKH